VNTQFESLVKPISCVDATIRFERNRMKGLLAPLSGRGELKSLVRTLRDGKFDAVLDMQGLFRSGLFARMSGAKIRVGESGAREGAWMFYTHRIDTPQQPVHARDRYDALSAALGCGKPGREDLDVSDDERATALDLLSKTGFGGGPLVAVCPGARSETKVYPPEKMARVLDTLATEAGVRHPVLTGSPDMHELCQKIGELCRDAQPINLCGRTTLRELAALLDISDLMLTCDSGPMHMAAAQGTAVCAVLGPTDARRTGPYGQLANVVTGECELMPCLKRKCPGLGIKCMRELEPGRIAEKALALLAATADKVKDPKSAVRTSG
jgi:ADP-heptose:LPS heptosyltransferase